MSAKLQDLFEKLKYHEAVAEECQKTILASKKLLGFEEKEIVGIKSYIQAEMGSVNEYQIEVEDELVSFKYTTPRASVRVSDIDAVPDEFVRIKREPDKVKIAEFLKNGHAINWAAFKKGEPQLTYTIEGKKND